MADHSRGQLVMARRVLCGALTAALIAAAPAMSSTPAATAGKGAVVHGGLALHRTGGVHRFAHQRHARASWDGFVGAPDTVIDLQPSEPPPAMAPPVELPPQPVTKRIPERYLERARQQHYAMLWVKTTDGWRRDSPTARVPTPRWERTPYGFHLAMRSDCEDE
jgi:hypothetical protein